MNRKKRTAWIEMRWPWRDPWRAGVPPGFRRHTAYTPAGRGAPHELAERDGGTNLWAAVSSREYNILRDGE